jgi:hypothetical protein
MDTACMHAYAMQRASASDIKKTVPTVDNNQHKMNGSWHAAIYATDSAACRCTRVYGTSLGKLGQR